MCLPNLWRHIHGLFEDLAGFEGCSLMTLQTTTCNMRTIKKPVLRRIDRISEKELRQLREGEGTGEED